MKSSTTTITNTYILPTYYLLFTHQLAAFEIEQCYMKSEKNPFLQHAVI